MTKLTFEITLIDKPTGKGNEHQVDVYIHTNGTILTISAPNAMIDDMASALVAEYLRHTAGTVTAINGTPVPKDTNTLPAIFSGSYKH